jgi:F420-non-reducing hydrogenase iron-sulfur subunit
VSVLKDLLEFVGIEGERLNLVWVSAAEGPRFAEQITKFTEKIRDLGPLNYSSQWPVPVSGVQAESLGM